MNDNPQIKTTATQTLKNRLFIWRGTESKFFGWTLIALGISAMLFPSIVTFGTQFILGFIIIIYGILQVVRLIDTPSAKHRAVQITASILMSLFGFMMIANPLASMISLAAVMAGYFVWTGIAYALRAYSNLKNKQPWIGIAFLSVLSVLFGFWVWGSVVMSSMLIVGYLLGFLLIVEGVGVLRKKHTS